MKYFFKFYILFFILIGCKGTEVGNGVKSGIGENPSPGAKDSPVQDQIEENDTRNPASDDPVIRDDQESNSNDDGFQEELDEEKIWEDLLQGCGSPFGDAVFGEYENNSRTFKFSSLLGISDTNKKIISGSEEWQILSLETDNFKISGSGVYESKECIEVTTFEFGEGYTNVSISYSDGKKVSWLKNKDNKIGSISMYDEATSRLLWTLFNNSI